MELHRRLNKQEQNYEVSDSAVKIWREVKLRLKNAIGDDAVANWIEDLRLIAEIDGEILIAARNRFIFERISRDYKRGIDKVWKSTDTKQRPVRLECWTKCTPDIKALTGDPWKSPPSVDEVNEAEKDKVHISGPDSMTFDTLVVGPSNEAASKAIKRIFSNSLASSILFVSGSQGVGKTHLLRALVNSAEYNTENPLRITYMPAEEFMSAYVDGAKKGDTQALKQKLRKSDVVAIDDLQAIAGKKGTEREFCSNVRAIIGKGGKVVLTADASPGDLKGLSQQLRNELQGATYLQIDMPDDKMREEILRNRLAMFKKADPNFRVSDDAVGTILSRVKGPGRELCGVLFSLHAETNFGEKPITDEIIAKVIRRKEGSLKPPSIRIVKTAVQDIFDVSKSDIEGASKARSVVYPRQIAMYLCRELTGKSFPQIAKCFGDRDHTTVMYGYRKIHEKLASGQLDAVKKDLERVRNAIRERQTNGQT